ncbi:MAG: phenylacetate-CoA oxygenase subunit PaaJ [Bacteroidia bacterium]|nr:phenylacetate-CoA oxygenase subunit PaaJ [Bacteroidia bacterium]
MVSESPENKIRSLLSGIPDPEIPVISIEELGILRRIKVDKGKVMITITPTYSGCPAMKQIEDDIVALLKTNGFPDVQVDLSYSPAWTTDWIPEAAREKLRVYGIAPPEKTSMDKGSITGKERKIRCPQCRSMNTEMISQFGSTACKALFRCTDCKEPFDYFKCI